MAPYSMDLRTRVLADRDAGVPNAGGRREVSRERLVGESHRAGRRETGEVAPRKQTLFKQQAFAGQEDRLRAQVAAKPDQTLVELRDSLHSAASVSSVWRALDRLKLTLKKNRTRRRTTASRRRR